MEESPLMTFYNQVMFAEDEDVLTEINAEIQSAVGTGELSDNKDIMILDLAVQNRTNYFMIMKTAEIARGETTIMFMGNPEDFDPEQLQLDELQEKELEDFKDGNVVSMKDFGKKKDDE